MNTQYHSNLSAFSLKQTRCKAHARTHTYTHSCTAASPHLHFLFHCESHLHSQNALISPTSSSFFAPLLSYFVVFFQTFVTLKTITHVLFLSVSSTPCLPSSTNENCNTNNFRPFLLKQSPMWSSTLQEHSTHRWTLITHLYYPPCCVLIFCTYHTQSHTCITP